MASIGGGELGVILGILSGLVTYLVIPVLLTLWGRRVARRKGGARPWRIASWLPLGALGCLALGIALSSVMLIASFATLADVDAASRATRLARGISEAMNFAAVGMAASALLFVGSACAFAYGEWSTRGRTPITDGPS